MTTDNKRSNNEEEYFKREDAERLRKLHAEEQARMRSGEREALRLQHRGRCSQCGSLMVPEQAGEVQMLHCPACGGAFLDRRAWEYMHAHAEPHTVMGAVLNWFKSANKP
jgi:predicted RNA-binding Zn-ribbon protein involved in translation (DUF1610 family)